MHEETYDCIISAIGQSGDYRFLSAEQLEQMRSQWGKFQPGDYQTSGLAKVFVGGDIANDVADAISAVEDGHHAARGIGRFLNGQL